MTKNTMKSALAALTAIALAATAIAQQPGPGQGPGAGPGRGRMGRDSRIEIVRMKSVQQHLGLSQEQVSAINSMQPMAGPRGEGGGQQGGPPPGEPGQRPDPLKDILNRNQLDRLAQLQLQYDSPMSLNRPDVAERLQLSEQQVQAIREIAQSVMPQRGGQFGGPPPGGGQQGGPPPGDQRQRLMVDWKEMQTKKAQATMQAMQVLDANQRAEWKAMTGDEFTKWEEPVRPIRRDG